MYDVGRLVALSAHPPHPRLEQEVRGHRGGQLLGIYSGGGLLLLERWINSTELVIIMVPFFTLIQTFFTKLRHRSESAYLLFFGPLFEARFDQDVVVVGILGLRTLALVRSLCSGHFLIKK